MASKDAPRRKIVTVPLEEHVKRLQKFKDYVHQRLDDMGVPASPKPAETEKTGCRIGPRLDWVAAQLDILAVVRL